MDRKLSHSSITTFLRCKQKYFWKYIENYNPSSSIGQVKGTVGHAALGEWYRTHDAAKALQVASDRLFEIEREMDKEIPEVWEILSIVLPRYFEWAEKEDDFEIIEIEKRFDFRIGGFDVVGYIDGIAVKDNGSKWLLENKFQKQVSMSHLEMDPQVTMYLAAMRYLGHDVQGVIYNMIRMQEGGIAAKVPVVRVPVYRNNEGLSYFLQETERTMQDMDKLHAGFGAVYRTPTRDCSWECSFYGACLAINDNGDAAPALRRIPKGVYEKEVEEEVTGESE